MYLILGGTGAGSAISLATCAHRNPKLPPICLSFSRFSGIPTGTTSASRSTAKTKAASYAFDGDAVRVPLDLYLSYQLPSSHSKIRLDIVTYNHGLVVSRNLSECS